jgi:hypothetical protein
MELEGLTLSMEGRELLDLSGDDAVGNSAYILLTDTKTRFSKLSKLITEAPYNHVSVAFDHSLKTLYTYALMNANGIKGGLKQETWEELEGANYSLYEIKVGIATLNKMKSRVKELEENAGNTRYNHLGLINAVFKKELFSSDKDSVMFCSQFVVELLRFSGIELFEGKSSSVITPYELVKSKILRFVKRGKIKRG